MHLEETRGLWVGLEILGGLVFLEEFERSGDIGEGDFWLLAVRSTKLIAVR